MMAKTKTKTGLLDRIGKVIKGGRNYKLNKMRLQNEKIKIKGNQSLGKNISRNVREAVQSVAATMGTTKINENRQNAEVSKAAIAKGLSPWNDIISQTQRTNKDDPNEKDDSNEESGSFIGG